MDRRAVPVFTERDGRELAVSMLHDLRNIRADETVIETEYRPSGGPQVNIVLRYLDTLREFDSRALEAGFAAVLTDFIAATAASGPIGLRPTPTVVSRC